MTIELMVTVPDALRTARKRVSGYWMKLVDPLFEARAEQVLADDDLDLAGRYDDAESDLEADVFTHMRTCPCACCQRLLPLLVRADRLDKLERGAHEQARAHGQAAGEYLVPAITLADAVLVRESTYGSEVAA